MWYPERNPTTQQPVTTPCHTPSTPSTSLPSSQGADARPSEVRPRTHPHPRPNKRPQSISSMPESTRSSGGGAAAAKRTRLDAGTVLHTFNALCAVRSCCLATGGAARCSAGGERLIVGHRPTVFGRVASVGAESDCVLEVLECSLTPWAPRSDLYHRSGRGAF